MKKKCQLAQVVYFRGRAETAAQPDSTRLGEPNPGHGSPKTRLNECYHVTLNKEKEKDSSSEHVQHRVFLGKNKLIKPKKVTTFT